MNNIRVVSVAIFAMFLAGCLGSSVKTESKQWPHDQTWNLLEKDGQVQPAVRKIIEILGQPVAEDIRADKFFEKYFPLFGRKQGLERWDLKELDLSAEKKRELYEQFEAIGIFKEVAPSKKSYKHALVLSATVAGMSKRLSYLIDLWKRGVRFERIAFLSCERPVLDFEVKDVQDYALAALPTKKNWIDPQDLPKTESLMMKLLWDRAEKPAELEKVPVDVVSVPMKKQPDGTEKRANTGDTYEAWIAQKPEAGTCFAVSRAPHIGYQDSIGRRWVPRDRGYETVGEGVDGSLQKIAVVIDAIFRQMLFEIYHAGLIDEKNLNEALKKA